VTAYVGVDIGTTNVKAIAYDEEGGILAEESGGYRLRSPHPGRAEQDPKEILDGVLGVLAKVVGDSGDEVACVSFSAAMHSLLALDEDGRPLTAAMTYADNRAANQATRIKDELDGSDIHRRTGTPVHPMSPLAKLLWFKEEDPGTFEAARWVSIKEYVFYELFGDYVVDHSIASATGLFNLRELDWDEGVLEMLGFPREKLSRPVSTTHIMQGLGRECAERLGLGADTPFVVGANDGVLANLGVGAVRPGMVACSIGTSGAVRSVVRNPGVDDDRTLFCYTLTEDLWVTGGPINNGGIALQWAMEEVFPGLEEQAEKEGRDPYDLVEEAIEDVPPGSDGLIFLPYLMGERAPHWNADVKGAFVGLTLQHKRKHLLRSVLEGVMYQMHAVNRALERVIGEAEEIRATGGFARSALWRQIMADVFGREILFPESHESSCWGAALLGMKALGTVTSLDAGYEMSRIAERHRPDTDAAESYEALIPLFGRLYERLEPEFAEISRVQRSMRENDDGGR
jgi:gluconokinase